MSRYGMVVDLNRCIGCQTCTIACKHANDTPPGVQWRQVLDIEQGQYPDVERQFLVVGCQHCAEPPCVPVCPTGATRQRDDGLVTMDYDTCIGCAYCAVSCPYQARTIVEDTEWYYGIPTDQEIKTHHPDRVGVASKCTFCVERIDDAGERGLTPGVDEEVTPACAVSCITQAIKFGDYDDPESEVSKLAENNRSFQMHAELGTDPQIRYLYEVPETMPGRAVNEKDTSDEKMGDPNNPLAGKLQTFWDMRAAMNFIMGGMTAGLVLLAGLACLAGDLTEQALLGINLAAGAGMGLGLFCVFLKIKQKRRFLYVLLRPQSSWMTRETCFVGLFYPALLAEVIWPQPALHLLVALAAAGFLWTQAMILYAAKGIPAWRVSLMPWMLVATGLFEGAGLLIIAGAMFPDYIQAGDLALVIGLVLALSNAMLWHDFRTKAAARGIPPLARRSLDKVTPVLHILGHTLPAVLFGIAILTGINNPFLLATAGVGAVGGGVLWKNNVITQASYQQGFALPMVPQRGSGKYAAPAKTQPGLLRS